MDPSSWRQKNLPAIHEASTARRGLQDNSIGGARSRDTHSPYRGAVTAGIDHSNSTDRRIASIQMDEKHSRLRTKPTGTPRKQRISPLQKLETKLYTILGVGPPNFGFIEYFMPTVIPPWQIPPHTRIAPDQETAIRKHNKIKKKNKPKSLQIYTDGSLINHTVEAVAWCKQKQ